MIVSVKFLVMGWVTGIRFVAGQGVFFSACCPERLWGPPSLLSKYIPEYLSPGIM
jgi:hypothetical protein